MSPETYLLYLATVLVFFATPPGSSQILIMTTAARMGARKAWPTAAGDLSANALQMTIAALGLASILASSATALTVIKWVGVAYLAFLGLRMFFAPAQNFAEAPEVSRKRLFAQGFLTSGANPEAIFFFAALFPQFLDLSQPIFPQLIILGATYLIIDGVVLAGMAAMSGRLLSKFQTRGRLLNRLGGAGMMAAAAVLGAKDVSPNRS